MAERHCIFMDVAGYGKWQGKCREIAAYMEEFEEQGGIAFIILYFTAQDEIYYIPYRHIAVFWKRMEEGGRKSFTYEELDTYILTGVCEKDEVKKKIEERYQRNLFKQSPMAAYRKNDRE